MSSLWVAACLQEGLHEAQGAVEDEAEGLREDPSGEVGEDTAQEQAQALGLRADLMVGQGCCGIWFPASRQALGMLCCLAALCHLQDGQCCAQCPASCGLLCSCCGSLLCPSAVCCSSLLPSRQHR